MLERRELLLHALGEFNQIELAEIGLNEVKRRAGEPGELADLDFAVLRHRANRDDARLVAGGKRDHRLEHGAHLEHGALARPHAEREKCAAETVRLLVELPEGQLAVFGSECDPLWYACRGTAQRLADRKIDPELSSEKFLRLIRRRVGHAV